MTPRLMGVETEYAFTALDARGRPLNRGAALGRLVEVARARLPHLLDRSACGVYLANGARFYIDVADHPELSTPECADPWDVVRYVRAGDEILASLAAALPAHDGRIAETVLLRCNVDYSGVGTTWGCHESYLHRTDPGELPEELLPHLASRVVYTGAGGFNSRAPLALEFTLSPRVWHLEHAVSANSTEARGIFHSKDEPLANRGYHRLHLLCGESVCSEMSLWLKVGATALVVALIDGGVRPRAGLELPDPVEAMRQFAADPTCQTAVRTTAGASVRALDIQRRYLEQAEKHLRAPFMPPWAATVCQRWRAILDLLESAPASVLDILDWGIKYALFTAHARRGAVPWESIPRWNAVLQGAAEAAVSDAAMRSGARFVRPDEWVDGANVRAFLSLREELFELDARFGQVGEKGLFAALDRAGVLRHRVPGVEAIDRAMQEPPAVGRAKLRGNLVQELSRVAGRYLCDWQAIWDVQDGRIMDLSDPFQSAGAWQPRRQGTAAGRDHLWSFGAGRRGSDRS